MTTHRYMTRAEGTLAAVDLILALAAAAEPVERLCPCGQPAATDLEVCDACDVAGYRDNELDSFGKADRDLDVWND